ncbi:hypothetical protein FDH01_gp253 [Acinetobacter phage vB_AbaM_ME3]|uniref:Uncharacterized protein n=1 Tax=Acinetobacter phage vB_AbaM_ME3 TaxID=1837876 RepID=A0A172Q0P7_9CAUD|nr:hypothetical protein FDH01_gp253 [Acinetobacter phage vB_AbaM_ME3]AND75369.1 hypothetical protein ME3_208 [Acinetobacter phage vB_AbaM_ME3]
MFILFLLVVSLLSIGFILADKKAPVSQEHTYLLYSVVTVGMICTLCGAGILSLIIYYLWHTGKIAKWYQSIK